LATAVLGALTLVEAAGVFVTVVDSEASAGEVDDLGVSVFAVGDSGTLTQVSSITKGKGTTSFKVFTGDASGDDGATTAAATAALVSCALCLPLQHFEQQPPVAAFPCDSIHFN